MFTFAECFSICLAYTLSNIVLQFLRKPDTLVGSLLLIAVIVYHWLTLGLSCFYETEVNCSVVIIDESKGAKIMQQLTWHGSLICGTNRGCTLPLAHQYICSLDSFAVI